MDISYEDPSKTINTNNWSDMDIGQLYSQKTILYDRMSAAHMYNQVLLLDGLQTGLDQLEYLITLKISEQDISDKNKNIIT